MKAEEQEKQEKEITCGYQCTLKTKEVAGIKYIYCNFWKDECDNCKEEFKRIFENKIKEKK